MAKGDKTKQQNVTDYGKNQNENLIANQRDTLVPQNQNFWNQYTQASGEAMNDYRDIMNQYKNFQQSPSAQPYNAERVNYSRSPELASALSGYQDFANTGGFSGNDIANMRARGISPIRAMYANAQNEIARQTNLQGGYSPNKGALLAKMAMSKNQQIADQVTDVEARLAEMRQQGRLAGLSGLGNLSVQDIGFGQQAQLANQAAGLSAAGLNAANYDHNRLAAIQGQANLFGQAPGMAGMFANNLLNSNNQWAQNTNQNLANTGQAMQGQYQVSQIPSNFQTGLGYAGQIGGMVGQIAAPFLTGGASSLIPSSRVPGAMSTYNQYPGIRT